VIPAISAALGPLNPSEWSLSGLGSAGSAAPASGSGSFANALSGALDSLQSAQNSAAGASQALATGTATDPTQAVTAVENASLEMDLASQIRTKLVDSVNTIFQTQV
jgi:flagellar hook-basal body complex protein FliE